VEPADLTIHPTVLVNVPLAARIMQEETFGPVLPVMTYKELDEVSSQVQRQGKPLALYVFSPNPAFVESVLMSTSSGGVTVNDFFLHAAENRLPFGGVNQSGIGRYSGIHGFRELSNPRSVFEAVQRPA
jgi:aldehyde dehydrogenase (NAD+)